MTFKILAALALVTGAAVNTPAIAAEEVSYPAGAVYTDSYFAAKKIPLISYNNLVLAYLSSRFRDYGAIDQPFADEVQNFLGYTMPEFNRVYHARKLSGMRAEADSDETIIGKFRPQVSAMFPTSEVYVDVLLSLNIVKDGRIASEYKDAVGGFQGMYELDHYSAALQREFANTEHATRIDLKPDNIVVTVPYVKTDFQREVYDAVGNNRPLKKTYRARLVMKIAGCKRVAGYSMVTCTPQLTSYQLFANGSVGEGNLVKGATIRIEQ